LNAYEVAESEMYINNTFLCDQITDIELRARRAERMRRLRAGMSGGSSFFQKLNGYAEDEDAEEVVVEGESSASSSEDEMEEKNSSSNEGETKEPRKKKFEGDEDVRAEGDASSDEEQERNTIGNVPLKWYDDYDHVGYDKAGKKVERKQGMDAVERFLASKDDPYYRRTVYDAKNDRSIVLTDRELIMVRRMLEGKFPEVGVDAEPDYVDYFSSEKMVMPLTGGHEPKRRFVPSKSEKRKIMSLAHAIKMGYLSLGDKPPPSRKQEFFLMWGDDDMVENAKKKRGPKHLPAPKVPLPTHRESYHPPPEYLPTEEEIEEWKNAHPDDRKLNYLPQDHGRLRKVPAFPTFIQERYERCMDLYLCPRKEKMRLNIDPESLVPRLPKPSDLRPYPTRVAVTYFGHHGRVRTLAVDPSGEMLASAGDDLKLRVWEVDSGRCLFVHDFSFLETDATRELCISKIDWNPQSRFKVVAVAIEEDVYLVNVSRASCCAAADAEETFQLLRGNAESLIREEEGDGGSKSDDDGEEEERSKKKVQRDSSKIVAWEVQGEGRSAVEVLTGKTMVTRVSFKESDRGKIMDMVWHAKGEYLATISDTKRINAQVAVHHVRKRLSQRPLTLKKEQRMQRLLFHPRKPILFVASKIYVNVYHLVQQKRISRLRTGVQWISSMGIHPDGDNLVIGSYDRKVVWFDLDLSMSPWKTLKYHNRAIRSVTFHQRYPLFATSADDGAVHVFHAKVFDNFSKDPFVVPVKVLRGHTPTTDGLGVLQSIFHPTQPWIFTAGADGRVQLFQNIP